MKKPTNIKIKGKGGKEIRVMIDDDPPPNKEYTEAIEGGILAKINQIVADAVCTADVVSIDPNDPWGEGKVIAKAGAVNTKEFAAALAGANEGWLRIGDDLLLPPHPDQMGFMQRANADLMTARLRTEMTNVAAELEDDMAPEDAKPLLAWTSDVRIENFAEWLLDRGGWDKATAKKIELCDELKRCFAGVPASMGESVQHDAIKGDELTEWPIKWRAIRLAGKHSAPIEQAQRALVAEEAPADYLEGLQMAFRGRFWNVLLKTGDTDERDKKGKPVPVEDSFAWLRMMVRPYVEEQAAGMMEHRATALAILIRPKATTEDGDQISGYPRALSLASFMGGQFSIQANGENYFEEPSLAAKAASEFNRAIKQRCVEIVPKQWTNANEQITLALDLDVAGAYLRDPYGGPLEVMTRTAMQARMPNMALKMFPVLFAVVPMSGRWVEGKRGDWIPLMFPDYAKGGDNQILPWSHRRQKKRDLEMLTAGFVCGTKGLQLKTERPNGSVMLSDLWLTEYDPAPEFDAINRFAPAPWLAERWRGGTAGGFFLLNMTRWTTLGLSNPRIFPLALLLHRIFDEHRVGGLYDRSRVKPIRWDELARQCNMLPLAIEGRSDETIKARTRQARAMIEGDLKALIDVGLLGAESLKTKKKIYGEGFEFMPIAPEDYAGACERANNAVRKNQQRKAKRKGRQG